MKEMRAKTFLSTITIVGLLFIGEERAAARRGQGAAIELLEAVEAGKPEEALAVRVSKAQLQMGPGTLVIEDGVLLPSAPVNGRTLEAAFVGEAWFRFAATERVESGQLELFTGDTTLLTPVTHAVLVAGDDSRFKQLLAGERAAGAQVGEALKLYKSWTEGAERQGFAADLAMVKALFGDPLYRGYFAAWCRSPDHGDFYFVLDPSEAEPLILGQFVPLDMAGLDVWQQRWFRNLLRAVKFFGRFANFSVEHPGNWDTWVSTAMDVGPDSPAEPEHYVLDIYVNPHIELDARGSAKIRLRAGSAGARTVSFSLYAGLKVTGVFSAGGEPLDFVRREGALHVFLPEHLPAGEKQEIRVDYEGDLVETLAWKESYALLSTRAWYPQTGRVDRATYDVTLRRPKQFTVLASGRVTETGHEGDRAWERRTLDLPATGFTFELGLFDVVSDRAGHVELTFGFQGGDLDRGEEERAKVIDLVKKSLLFFEERFGPYPLDYLTVVTVDRGFSQGSLSMLTLALAALESPDERATPRWRERAEEQTMLTIAHEVSHQWWGNWVGWASYRDQWLSEAVASYSALLYGMTSTESRAAFLARNALDWRSALMATAAGGRTVGSLGPVTLGYRLNSSKSSRGYQAIAYKKGEVVLRMLARLLGEERFSQMLGEVAKAVANRTIDTATFLRSLERMSGQDLKPFADRFVYGTGIPEVYYRYSFQLREDGKGWIISGRARQIASKVESLMVVEDEEGHWRVDRRLKVAEDVPTSTLIVPFQVIITPPETVKKKARGTIQRDRGFGGRVVLRGHETPFEYTVPEKPERFELDQLGEVLARFHDEEWSPKGTLRTQAEDLEASGAVELAETLLRRALESPVYSERAVAWLRSDAKKEKAEFEESAEDLEKFENARIRTILARFLVDRGELDLAEKEILAAEQLLEKPDSEAGWRDRRILRSRIDLARGDGEAAYRRLRNGLVGGWLGSEGYALLAVAATVAGHDRVAGQALGRAEDRGVDVRALRNARSAATGSSR